jgi:hypothetical protein
VPKAAPIERVGPAKLMSMANDPDPGKVRAGVDKTFFGHVVDALSGQPVFVLVFAVAVVIFTVVGASLSGTWLGVSVVGTLVLVAFTVLMSYRQLAKDKDRSVILPSRAEARRVVDRERRREEARALLEGIADPEADVFLVYSSLLATELQAHDGRSITHQLSEEERQITTLFDVQGISGLESLVREARGGSVSEMEEEDRLHRVSAFSWVYEWLSHNVVLVGGPSANPNTVEVMESSGCPFRFGESRRTPRGRKRLPQIEETSGRYGPWPPDPWAKQRPGQQVDYGILAKLKKTRPGREQVIYLVVAGLGSYGTLATCTYLQDNVDTLYSDFRGDPFACVIAAPESQPQDGRREVAAVLRDGQWRFTEA